MNESSKSRMITAAVVLLGLVVLLQLGLLLQRQMNRPAPEARWNPADEMEAMQSRINRMFDADEGWAQLEITPGLSLHDEESGYVITVNLPGVDQSGIHVSLNQSILELLVEQDTSTRTTPPGGATVRESHQTSRFERHLRLPGATTNPADVQAVFEKGVLKILVPKASEEPAREVQVKAGG